MVMYNVYTSNIKRKYRAHFCSFATLFLICTLGLTVICPVLAAYHSNGKNNFQILTLLGDKSSEWDKSLNLNQSQPNSQTSEDRRNVFGSWKIFLATKVSPIFLVMKFWGNAQFLQSFGCLAQNYVKTAFPRSFRTSKVGEITIFYAERRKRMQVKIFVDVFLSVILFMSPIHVLVLTFITLFPRA